MILKIQSQSQLSQMIFTKQKSKSTLNDLLMSNITGQAARHGKQETEARSVSRPARVQGTKNKAVVEHKL